MYAGSTLAEAKRYVIALAMSCKAKALGMASICWGCRPKPTLMPPISSWLSATLVARKPIKAERRNGTQCHLCAIPTPYLPRSAPVCFAKTA